jgi:hypothetical protein
MTYTPDYIRLSTNPDVLSSGAQRINANFDNIATGIDEAIDGLAYQNPVVTITAIAPTTGITLGARYIVDFGVLEADPWYGHIDEIAELSNDDPYEWVFLEPEAGWCCTVLDEELEYLYNDEQWNQRPALISHNLLANIDGSTYHVSSDVYDALAGTGTPSTNNKFVTADSLTTDITTHTHDGEVTAQVDYGNLDNIPSTFTPASHTHAKADVTDFAHTHAKTDITDFDHASGHIKGTGDEIDGDKLDIDFNPSYYTPGTVTEADNVDHLSAHLHGIDLELNGKSDTGHTHTESDISDLGSYAADNHDHDSDYSAIGHTHSYASTDHDATHITGASDEIDGDKLDIDWNPTNYTPATVTDYADSVDNLTAHLSGIDTELGQKLESVAAAGSDTQIQFNDGGARAGAANLTWNKTTNRIALTGTSSSNISTLTDGASITPNLAVANNFTVTLGGNRTLQNPSNITVGQSGLIFVVQDGSGSKTLAYGTYWHFPGGTDPTASTAANAVDVITYFVRTSTSIVCQMVKDFK